MTSRDANEALKQLRQQRKTTIARARQRIKAQKRRFSAIKSQIESEPRTVPDIAAALGMDTADVLVAISALRKYGEVLEDAKDGDYFKYRLV